MWKRFHKILRCPLCANHLELMAFRSNTHQLERAYLAAAEAKGLLDGDFNQYIEEGVLLCGNCKVWFPVSHGLPILLTYRTALHERFATAFGAQLLEGKLQEYGFPEGKPEMGEQFVLESFSKEWGDYEYDGVLWEASYADLEQRFLREMSIAAGEMAPQTFLEVGCGLGITTYLAQKNYGADAVGADLSYSVLQASRHYKTNPFLHFAQASVFRLPFAKEGFDAVYSRGALHHTFSTHEAVKSLTAYCRPGGRLYLWVYGKGSINENHFRRLAYYLESLLRPILSRKPDAPASKAVLGIMALGYMGFNKLRRSRDAQIQGYNFRRAIHAARDRFTPRYAHRHQPAEVSGWFQELGFGDIEKVDWKIMPSVEQDDFRRNVGVRGRRLGGEDLGGQGQ